MLEDFTVKELEKKYKMKKQSSEIKAEFIERIKAQEAVDDAQDENLSAGTEGLKSSVIVLPQGVNSQLSDGVHTFTFSNKTVSINASASRRAIEKVLSKLTGEQNV